MADHPGGVLSAPRGAWGGERRRKTDHRTPEDHGKPRRPLIDPTPADIANEKAAWDGRLKKECLTVAYGQAYDMGKMETKTEIITVRLTPEEREMMHKAAVGAGLSDSEYIRVCIMMDRGINFDPVAWGIVKRNILAELDKLATPKKLKMVKDRG